MLVSQDKLKEFLVDSDLVSRNDIERVAKEAEEKGVSLAETLVFDGVLSEDEVRRAQAYVIGIPYISLKGEKIPFETLSLIPEPIARSHNVVALKKTESALEVAMLDTDDLAAIDFVKKKVGLKILPRLTDKESIKFALLQYQKSLKAEFGDIIRKEADTLGGLEITPDATNAGELKKLAEDIPIVRIVDTLIHHAILQDASDVHIEPQEKQVLIRYRIDGILRDAMELPRNAASGIIARIKVLADLKLDEKRLPQDGRFRIDKEDQKVSFRVSILPTYYGEKAVMRLLKEDIKGFTLEELGFHGEGLERIHKALHKTTGMILATGPTGSGKTTTLYTALEILNTPEVNISTIEDPIEYQLPRINQTQVKPEIGFAFANGLRSLVRQDPDIIMVGEIRDRETAGLAINAALTGHLVLSTLHTNSAAGAIPRLLDMQVESFLLTSTLDVIIAQRLVRQLCPDKEKYFLTKEEIKNLAEKADLDKVLAVLKEEHVVPGEAVWESIPFYRPKETAECKDGYHGRKGIHEVLKVTPSIKDLVMRGATTDEIESQARKEGMLTMIEDGLFKAAGGITTIEEVLRVISE
ncbi:MAG: Flp pilus assembly complex ATPase component TadA [Parcubacteria group bacterium]|nr:Flp pilus assembly complex ATPase component TadA [Parcubacteria group bacterium]